VTAVLSEQRRDARAGHVRRGHQAEAQDEDRAESRQREDPHVRRVSFLETAAARPRLPGCCNLSRNSETLGRRALPSPRRASLGRRQPRRLALLLDQPLLLQPLFLRPRRRLSACLGSLRRQDLRRSRTGRRRLSGRRRRWRLKVGRRRRWGRSRGWWRRRNALDRRRIRFRPRGERRRARPCEPDEDCGQNERARPEPTIRLSPYSHFRTPHLRRTNSFPTMARSLGYGNRPFGPCQ